MITKKQFFLWALLFCTFGVMYSCDAESGDDAEVNAEEITVDEMSDADTSLTVNEDQLRQELVDYGGLLIKIGGCNNCHTPKVMGENGFEPDPGRMLSGHPASEKLPPIDLSMVGSDKYVLTFPMLTAYVGPWGVSYAANLTPDENTGIGGWDKEQFIKTMRSGYHMGVEKGRRILPPMPWFNLKETPDADLEAMFVYLQSLPPVNNRVPDYIPMDSLKMKPAMLVSKR